jgi:hypothetical protein
MLLTFVDGRPDRVFDRNPSNDQEGIYVYLNTGSGFDSGQQWQNDLGDSWKNRPIHKGGEYSTLIDMNGDGLPCIKINIYSFLITTWISVKDTVG